MTDTTPSTDADDFVDRMIARFESSPAAPDAVLDALTAELRAAATWSGPPPTLRAAILARAAAIEPSPAVPVRRRWAWPSWGRLRWAVPVAALVAVVFTVATLTVDRALQ